MSPSKICPQCGGTFGPEERFCPKDGSALRPEGATDGLIGQVIADRYQIIQTLGEGGMGRVYLAEHVRMGRKSAVKVMSSDLALSADAISRFNREAANASRINHPNVAQIYDFGETDDGTLYLAMEFVEGETLSAIIGREGALPPLRAARLTKQIADALGAAHHMGIVHRDLKPDNIMVARHHDGSDWVKVVDFGIAKTIQGSGERGPGGSQTVTTAGVSIGTPEYMSPEQLAGDRLDNRTDVYSLGLVLFNMLTGDLPYPRMTSKATLVKRLTTRPKTLTEVAPKSAWPASLQAALDKALAPEVADRYASVADFGRDVMLVADELSTTDRTMPIASVPRPSSAATRPLLAPTTAVTPPFVAASAAQPIAPKGNGAKIAAGLLIVIAAVGSGAFLAMRNRPGSQQVAVAPGGDTAVHPSSAPTQAAAAPSLAADTSSKKPAAATTGKQAAPAPAQEKAPVAAPLSKPAAPVDVDTTPAVIPPPSAADTTSAGREKKFAGMRHTFLGANGDTAKGSATPATDEDKIRVLGADIQGHLVRAAQFIKQGEVQKARSEYRDAAPVVGVLRQLYPGNPAEQRVETMLRQGDFQTLTACRTAFADTVLRSKFPTPFRCESLIPPALRVQGRGRGGGFRER